MKRKEYIKPAIRVHILNIETAVLGVSRIPRAEDEVVVQFPEETYDDGDEELVDMDLAM